MFGKSIDGVMKRYTVLLLTMGFLACSKSGDKGNAVPVVRQPAMVNIQLDGQPFAKLLYNTRLQPAIQVDFSEPLSTATVAGAVQLKGNSGSAALNITLLHHDSSLLIQPAGALTALQRYTLTISNSLQSASGGALTAALSKSFQTRIDSAAKFPVLADDALLDLVQQKTFRYFWDQAHPVSGLARERKGSGDLVTTGGSGFGLMAIVTGVHRNFITRADGLARLNTIVDFLGTKAQRFHGAYPHWLNGATGAVIPFSTKDDGADLVETSYLVMGLLTARQFFDGTDPAETGLRSAITAICDSVQWSWFRKNNEEVLYWHWSPNYNWDINLPIKGWNECLITYVLAAGSAEYGIPASVYTSGWAGNGSNGFLNGEQYYGIKLPLGPAYGGPLFTGQYSFLGLNPNGLKDAYAAYDEQCRNQALIQYQYAIANPNQYFGYSATVWGLTASDIPGGYDASSPTHDLGVIAPTAALGSMPFTPDQSLAALRFYYYVLGDRIWTEDGFMDAFSLKDLWYSNSYLAIDQGPILLMIENYRSGLLWNLFSACPEVKAGLHQLGFTAPYL